MFRADRANYYFALSLLVLSILSGQVTINRFVNFGSVAFTLKNVFLTIAFIFAFLDRTALVANLKTKIPATISTLLILLLVVAFLNLMKEGSIQDPALYEVLYIILVSFLGWLLIRRRAQLVFVFGLASIACASIALVDAVLRIWSDLTIITNISVSRITLVGLASLIVRTNLRQKITPIDVFGLVIFGFSIFSNSLKTGIIASFVFFLFVVVFFVKTKAYRQFLLLTVACTAGALIAVVSGQTSPLASRLDRLKPSQMVLEPNESPRGDQYLENQTSKPFADSKQLADRLCSGLPAFNYCRSNIVEFKIVDRTERIRMWLYSIDLLRKDWLFGVGRKNFQLSLFYDDGQARLITYTYPHNLIFEYLSMYGVVGALTLIGCLVTATFTYWRAIKFNEFNLVLFGLSIALLLAAMFGGTLIDIRYVFFFSSLPALWVQITPAAIKGEV